MIFKSWAVFLPIQDIWNLYLDSATMRNIDQPQAVTRTYEDKEVSQAVLIRVEPVLSRCKDEQNL